MRGYVHLDGLLGQSGTITLTCFGFSFSLLLKHRIRSVQGTPMLTEPERLLVLTFRHLRSREINLSRFSPEIYQLPATSRHQRLSRSSAYCFSARQLSLDEL